MTPIPQVQGSEQSDGVRIEEYDDTRREGVVELLRREYGGDIESHTRRLEGLFDHRFHRHDAIRIVALDGRRVVGFQSLFVWPIRRGEQRYKSLQQGNSIVSADRRGQGLFGRILRYQDTLMGNRDIDFLIGFPVDIALGSYVRNGWKHALDLCWYARPLGTFAALKKVDLDEVRLKFDSSPQPISQYQSDSVFALSDEPAFLEWREQLRSPKAHFFFHHVFRGHQIRFDLRLEERGRFKVLVIGGIARESGDRLLLDEGLKALIKAARAHAFIFLLVIALNERCLQTELKQVLRRRLFFRLRPRIHFIVKNIGLADRSLYDPTRWELFRGDVDTW